MARDDFEGQSGGGGLSDFTFEVTDAYFGNSPALDEIASEREGHDVTIMLLHLIGKTDDDNQPILDHDGFHPSYQLTEDWVTSDGGKSVTYEGSRAKPRLGKKYGAFVDRVLEITAELAESSPDEDPLGGDANPKIAATWIGTKWYMEDEPYNWDFEGRKGTSSKLMPTKFLGRFDVDAAATPAAAAAPAADNGTLRASVEALAKSTGDYASFQTAALSLPNITDDTALLAEIANPDGIYATVNA